MGKNKERSLKTTAQNEPTAHQKFKQRAAMMDSRKDIYAAFSTAAENAHDEGFFLIGHNVQERVIAALQAGHMQDIRDATGFTEERVNKIAKGTQKAEGTKLERLKTALDKIEQSHQNPETAETVEATATPAEEMALVAG